MSADEQTPDATEVVEILKGVVDTFASKEDMKAAREAGQIISDLEADANDKHQEMLQSIKELTGVVQRAKTEHHERKSTLLDKTQKEQLLAERTRVEDNIRRMQQDAESLKYDIELSQGKASELGSHEQQIRQQEVDEVKRAKHTISLYANISSIKWDYASANVKGWITSASGSRAAGMKAFEMEPNRHTDFAVTNYLWELMDAV